MGTLLLHPSSMALWHALLYEAQKTCSVHLQTELEIYLVYLLMRYTQDQSLVRSVLGLEFLQGSQQIHDALGHQLLKDVGDKCLLTAGLFPQRALRKQLQSSYFISLGQSAYSAASQYDAQDELLLMHLCHAFPKMTNILQAMRQPYADWKHQHDLITENQKEHDQHFNFLKPKNH